MELTKSIIIDLQHPGLGPIPLIHAKPDDTARKLQLTLTSGGAAWTPPSGTTAAVRFRKPDNTSGIYDTMPDGTKAYNITDNVVTVAIVPDMLSCSGDVTMDVLLVSASATLATFNITVRVQAAPALGNTESGDFYKYMTLEQLNAAIDDLYTKVGSGSSGLSLDTTLTKSGYAADAKAVGNRVGSLASLRTQTKASIVAAINELVTRTAALESGSGSGGQAVIHETWVPWTEQVIPFELFPSGVAGTKLTLQVTTPAAELINLEVRPRADSSFEADAQAIYGYSFIDSTTSSPATIQVINNGNSLLVEASSGTSVQLEGFIYSCAQVVSVASTEVQIQEV